MDFCRERFLSLIEKLPRFYQSEEEANFKTEEINNLMQFFIKQDVLKENEIGEEYSKVVKCDEGYALSVPVWMVLWGLKHVYNKEQND